MRVLLRADASADIGSGHVMRQLALAEELIRLRAEVVLVGDVAGPSWLIEKVGSITGLLFEPCEAADFDFGPSDFRGASVAVVDSYSFNNCHLEQWVRHNPNTYVFVDGPWQELSGHGAIVQALDTDAEWVRDVESRFKSVFSGPKFWMIRREIREESCWLDWNRRLPPQVLVVLGGTDVSNHTQVVLGALDELSARYRIVYPRQEVDVLQNQSRLSSSVGFFPFEGKDFVSELKRTSLAISAAGTTAGELLYLGIPSILLPFADNQLENGKAVERLGVADVLWPGSTSLVEDLKSLVVGHFGKANRADTRRKTIEELDGLGAVRLATLLLESG